jgi:hypothetical protein
MTSEEVFQTGNCVFHYLGINLLFLPHNASFLSEARIREWVGVATMLWHAFDKTVSRKRKRQPDLPKAMKDHPLPS